MHIPVMFKEVAEYLSVQPRAKIIDATLNGAGHTLGIFQKFPDVKILGVEYDPEIFEKAIYVIRNPQYAGNSIMVNDSYVNLKKITEDNSFKPDGIIFD